VTGVLPLPTHGGVFLDARGDNRSLRVSWHHDAGEAGLVVLSLWRGGACVATFRLAADEVEALVEALTAGVEHDVATGTGSLTA